VQRLALVLLAVALLAGCGGGGPSADEVLKQTASNLGKIRSGVLGLKLLVTPPGQGEPFGFELHGPFALRPSGLPVARIVYTRIANGARSSATFVSDGADAYVELQDGQRNALTPGQASVLRSLGPRIAGAAGGAGRLVVGRWLKNADASDGPGETDRVTAELDVEEAVPGLFEIARAAGWNVNGLGPADVDRLDRAVRSTRFVLYSGKRDRLLRRLELSVEFTADVREDARRALGDLTGAKVEFEVRVDRPNSVSVGG